MNLKEITTPIVLAFFSVVVVIFLFFPQTTEASCTCYCKKKTTGQEVKMSGVKDEATCKSSVCGSTYDFVKCVTESSGSGTGTGKGIPEFTLCGVDGAYTGSDYKKVESQYGSGAKCASGLQCYPTTCSISEKKVTYRCEKTAILSSQDVKDCQSGKMNEQYEEWKKKQAPGGSLSEALYLQKLAALAACKAKAPKDRGIFTRGLSDYCLGCGECTQCDVFQIITNIVSFVFSIAGALAVFFIVNTGFSFALARGNQEAITKAKQALAAVVIGVIIILIAWALVNTVLTFWLGYKNSGSWFYPNFSC